MTVQELENKVWEQDAVRIVVRNSPSLKVKEYTHTKNLLVKASWLVAFVAYLFLVEPALATKNQDIQQNLSDNGLVYGIDLTKYKNQVDNREVQNELDDGPKGLGDYLGKFVQYIQEEQFLIVGVGIVLLLILINYFAVTQSYDGRATYFADYGDVFWFYLPATIILLTKVFVWWMFGDISLGSQVVKVCLTFACVYNLIRPFVDNRQAPLFLAVSVCISRFTLGYVLILAMAYTLIGMYPAKQTDESNRAYELRKQTAIIKGAAILTAIGFMVRSLVGRAEYYDYSEYDYMDEIIDSEPYDGGTAHSR